MQRKHKPLKPDKRVLVIHQNARMRKHLANGWKAAGGRFFQAEEHLDGLRMLYEVHPDVIILDQNVAREDDCTLISDIRLITDTPIIILANPAGDIEKLAEQKNVTVVNASEPVAKIISRAEVFMKACSRQQPAIANAAA